MTLLYLFKLFFSRMGRCEQCVPCFIKHRCQLCSNCMPNSKGNRQHYKCMRQICVKDRKTMNASTVDSNSAEEMTKYLLKTSQDIMEGKTAIQTAKQLDSPAVYVKSLSEFVKKKCDKK